MPFGFCFHSVLLGEAFLWIQMRRYGWVACVMGSLIFLDLAYLIRVSFRSLHERWLDQRVVAFTGLPARYFLYFAHNSSMNTFECLRPFLYHLCNFTVQ